MGARQSTATRVQPSHGVGTFDQGLDEFAKLYRGQFDTARIKDEVVEGVRVRRIAAPGILRHRAGNHPKVLHHRDKTADVVVLIHGITDSPHYVEAIGRRFHKLGFNVVLPLLPAHGLMKPWPAMRKLEHKDWLADVNRIMDIAPMLGERVSMGGFSTGGALTIHKVSRDPAAVTGGLYLFAAALEIGTAKELLLESDAGPVLSRIADTAKWLRALRKNRNRSTDADGDGKPDAYGIGANPFKYSVFFYEGASELAEVIDEIDKYYSRRKIDRYSNIAQPLFVAHSPIDQSADFSGARRVFNAHPNRKKAFCDFCKVEHARLVLDKTILKGDKFSHANPKFGQMMEMLEAFTARHVTG